MIKKIWILLLLFPCFCINAHAEDVKLFPEVSGWKMKVEQRVYNASDLWELINGAADIFLSYYFQDLHIAEYTSKNKIIRVELYRHLTADDTYGIYTAERMPDYPQVQVGSQGYKSQGVLNFLAGNYYVKVMSAGVEEADESAIALIAEKVNTSLAQPVGLPVLSQVFPDEGKVYLSDTYIAQNFMGYSFFHNAFSVKYEKPVQLQLFVIRLTEDETGKMLEQYIKTVKEDKVSQKNDLYRVDDMFNGPVFLKKKDNYLIGTVNTTDESAAAGMIDRLIQNLP
ncbi:MAG: hypothetical protein JXA72_05600 [Bacteroidales bacterium]|nr:hypothetical protein [Bacteroidales bacterium]